MSPEILRSQIPNDTWPRHGRDYFRAALTYARKAGWSFGKAQDHSFGKVVCNRELPKGSRCEFLVFSSGSGSESAAKELRSLVDQCPHRPAAAGSRVSAVEAASELLDEADLLIGAAERCLAAEGMLAAAEDLLDLAATAADNAHVIVDPPEVALEEAVELEASAQDTRREAAGLADVAGYASSSPVEAAPLLGAAGDRVDIAERKLGRSRSGRTRLQVRQRLDRTRARIQDLRDQLGL